MKNPIDNLENLSKVAEIRKITALHEEKIKRQSQWKDVQEKTPEIANFMLLVAKHFGKPEKVKVWYQNILILEK